jgi:hypothetical protein
MAKVKENGKEPVNARINIKYNENKPKISFSYPDKKNQVRGSMLFTIFMFWFLISALVYLGWDVREEVDVLDLSYDQTALEKFTKCAVMNAEQTINNYSNVIDKLCKAESTDLISFKVFILLGLFFIPPLLIYYPFKKKWNSLYPKWQGLTASKKVREFNKYDIIEDEKGIYCELPVFNNIVCDFKCTGDFSTNLKEIDIREYKFHHLKKRTVRIKKKKKKIKKVNEFIWYARWYFEKKPIKGKLRVIYK